jgi:hypothetical protein
MIHFAKNLSIRGGSWWYTARNARVGYRLPQTVTESYLDLCVRVAKRWT